MDFLDLQNMFNKMFPDKFKTFTFDEKCVRQVEMVLTDGNPHPKHHIEYYQVKVSIQGMPDQYVQILPHREIINLAALKQMVSSKHDVHINESEISAFKAMPEANKSQKLQEWVNMTGLPRDQIERKLRK